MGIDDDGGRVPPMEPFPTARRGHPEEPMRLSSSTTTRAWTAVGWVLGALLVLVLAFVVLFVAATPRP